ncbi:MAG TPA: RNase H-like domain-containing protein, partial [Ktedonobacteraceae bacterium]
MLRHFDYSRPATVEADASDYAEGGVLSQRGDDGILHPVAFHSRKFSPAEQNYEIYDKEMQASVDCLTVWRHHLQGSGHQIQVITDHKNLLWFTETKVYNRRQARWAEKLSHFDFAITYRPGPLGVQPDALSRRPDHGPMKGGEKNPNEFQFLKSHQIKDFPLHESSRTLASLATIPADPDTAPTILEEIKRALPGDEQIGRYLQYLQDPAMPRPDDAKVYLAQFTLEDDLVLKRGLIYVPAQDPIKLQLLQAHHDAPLAGHPGQDKTHELLSRNYTWPGMRQWVNQYVNSCDTCARNKTPRQRPHGSLQPLPIPIGPWKSISMDYIVELPPSHGHDAIYVCVDRFTKMAHFSATTSAVTAQETARLFLRDVTRLHGLPSNIVSDRGSQFTAKFTKSLLELCEIKGNLSTAFHPQSDGQTERVNQVLEQYLRIFCHYQQDNWYDLLPLAEFAYNNAKHASTQTSPFFANYGYHPRMSIVDPTPREGANPAAEAFVEKFERVHNDLRHTLRKAQLQYKAAFDAHVKESPPFQPGDLVWLSRKHIKTTRPSLKLDAKRLGPFKITEVVGEARSAYRIELPAQMRIHPVFHVSLLTPYRANEIPGRTQPPPPPIMIDGE